MTDLWPDDLETKDSVQAPVVILKEQATLLGKKTGNLVTAEVKANRLFTAMRKATAFRYDFFLCAPALGPYRYRVFSIEHDIDLYPVLIDVGTDIRKEIFPDESARAESSPLEAPSKEEFLEILKKILGSEKTRKVISALRAQIEA